MLDNEYVAGQRVAVTGSFYDNTQPDPKPLVDPPVVKFRWGQPGAITTWTYGIDPQLTKLSTGTYQAQIDTTPLAGGEYIGYMWAPNQPGQAAAEIRFVVKPTII